MDRRNYGFGRVLLDVYRLGKQGLIDEHHGLHIPTSSNEDTSRCQPTREFTGRLLVAEDNPVNCKVMSAMLRHLAINHDVVKDGSAAVEACRRRMYDGILLDCRMPVLDGYGASKQIRELSAHYRQVPIIAITAEALAGEQQRCKEAEMDGCLVKPVALETLQN